MKVNKEDLYKEGTELNEQMNLVDDVINDIYATGKKLIELKYALINRLEEKGEEESEVLDKDFFYPMNDILEEIAKKYF